MKDENSEEAKNHHLAMKKAKKLRSFYRSLMLFLMVNILLVINHFIPDKYNNGYLWLLIIWGLFLIYQGLSFTSGFWIFSDSWEKKYADKKTKNIKKS